MKSRQQRNLQNFQIQMKLQSNSITCQFKITLRRERQQSAAFLLGLKDGASQLVVAAAYRTKTVRVITVGLSVRCGTSQSVALLL